MDLRHLEVFNAVMRTGTTVGAAHFLGASQPTVSNTIRHLEDMLGFDLFDRTKGRLIPTEEAKLLFRQAQDVFAAFANTQRMVEEIQTNRRGSLTVVATPTVGNSILPTVVAAFARPAPEVKVIIEIDQLQQVIQMVERGAADVGVAVNPFSLPTIGIEPLVRAPMVCVLAKDHPLAARKVVSPLELAGLPLISFSRDTVLGRQIEVAFAKHGCARKINIEVRYCETACALAQSGAGIAVVDPFVLMSAAAFPGLAVRAFAPRIETKLCLIRPKLRRLSRIAQRFVRVLTSHFELRQAHPLPASRQSPARMPDQVT